MNQMFGNLGSSNCQGLQCDQCLKCSTEIFPLWMEYCVTKEADGTSIAMFHRSPLFLPLRFSPPQTWRVEKWGKAALTLFFFFFFFSDSEE